MVLYHDLVGRVDYAGHESGDYHGESGEGEDDSDGNFSCLEMGHDDGVEEDNHECED